MTDVHVDRPEIPDGYGVPDHAEGLLSWQPVEKRLGRAKHYWLSTSRPDGRPHAVPRWGVWLDGAFWYDGAPTTRHVQNLRSNDHCSLHLEDGAEPIIVEGKSVQSAPVTGELGRLLSDAFCQKYGTAGYSPDPDAWSDEVAGGLRVLRPLKAMAWNDFPNDVTRFTFQLTGPVPDGTSSGLV